MNTDVCATLDDLFNALKDSIRKEDIIYAKTTSQIICSLVEERSRRKMTQQEFANKLNVKQSMISRWEGGNSNFTIRTLSKIAADLDLDLYVNLVPHIEIQFIKPEHYRTLNPIQSHLYCDSITSTACNNFKHSAIYTNTNKSHTAVKEVIKW